MIWHAISQCMRQGWCFAEGHKRLVIVCDANIIVSSKMQLLMQLVEDWAYASDAQISLEVAVLVPYIVLKVSMIALNVQFEAIALLMLRLEVPADL